MFRNLFRSGAPQRDIPYPVALAAVMVKVARADGHFSQDEKEIIVKILSASLEMTPVEASEICDTARDEEKQASDVVRFTKVIKDNIPLCDRANVVQLLWMVVLSDGDRDHEEDAAIRLLINLLGVSDQESAKARQRAVASVAAL